MVRLPRNLDRSSLPKAHEPSWSIKFEEISIADFKTVDKVVFASPEVMRRGFIRIVRGMRGVVVSAEALNEYAVDWESPRVRVTTQGEWLKLA